MDEIDVTQATGQGNGRRMQASPGLERANPGALVIPILRGQTFTTRGGGLASMTVRVGPVLKHFGPLLQSACLHLLVKDASDNLDVAANLIRSYDGETWQAHEILAVQTGNGYRISTPVTDRTKFGNLLALELVFGDNSTVQFGTLWGDLVLEFLG